MAMVKCEYCGSYINDVEEKCPNCGAINKDFKRTADGTPRTIEELKSWYIARNLPPEEVTRFFIGKNVVEPRAFGIYEENGEFVVYKNKSNGSRATRYRGRDEAYAVNELYLRLKEEILNQKNMNANARKVEGMSGARKYRRTGCNLGCAPGFIMACIIMVISVFFVMNFHKVTFSSIISEIFDNQYYMTDAGDIYYRGGYNSDYDGYVWWKYDKTLNVWSIYDTYENRDRKPDGVTELNGFQSIYDLTGKHGGDPNELDIRKSRVYIDAGNHMTPSTSYYAYNNKLYYFLDDNHSSYGKSNNTGWYVFEKNKWKYYCSEDDKEKLGEDLWYSDSDYRITSNYNDIYNYQDQFSTKWNPTDFEDTTWYQSYESNNASYNEYIRKRDEERRNNNNNNSSNDSDWDWDSDDDWDSGSTDWDSDW